MNKWMTRHNKDSSNNTLHVKREVNKYYKNKQNPSLILHTNTEESCNEYINNLIQEDKI